MANFDASAFVPDSPPASGASSAASNSQPFDASAFVPDPPTAAQQMSVFLNGKNPQAAQSALTSPGINSPMGQGALTALKIAAPITAGAAGTAALSGLGATGQLANIGGQVGGGAIYGAASNPQTPFTGAVENAAMSAIPFIPGLLKGGAALAGGIKDFLTGATNDASGQGAVGQLNGGLSPDKLNTANNLNIVQSYNNVKNAATQLYKSWLGNTAVKGYATSGSPGISGLDIASPGKFIKPQATTGSIIDLSPTAQASKGATGELPTPAPELPGIFSPTAQPAADNTYPAIESAGKNLSQQLSQNNAGSLTNQDLFSNVSSDTQKMIQNYNNSPTVLNAHLLRSQLGGEEANLRYGGQPTPAQLQTANAIKNVRGNLDTDIINTFNNNGDSDLAQQYQAATNNYKNTVVPYLETPQVWRTIQGNKMPNAVNVLAGDDTQGNAEANNPGAVTNNLGFIRSQVAQIPGAANQLMGSVLKNVSKVNFAGEPLSSAEDILQAVNNAPSNITDMLPAETKGLFSQLQQNVTKRNNVVSALKAAKYPALGAAAYVAHKIF